VKKVIAGGLAAAIATGLAMAGPANAQPGCQTSPWGFLGLTKQRLICDGPILPDGSWWRHRVIGRPGYWARPSRSCTYGDYSSYCTYDDGGWVPERDDDDETYLVRPETLLPDEPGHLG
jgi:hypothetical protein